MNTVSEDYGGEGFGGFGWGYDIEGRSLIHEPVEFLVVKSGIVELFHLLSLTLVGFGY